MSSWLFYKSESPDQSAMNKQSRHFAVRQTIANNVVANQDELRLLLESQGYEVTQATLSRDLKELGVSRAHTPQGTRYVLPASGGEERKMATLVSYEVLSIEANEAMVVIRTLPGRAAGVADIIDSQGHAGILGTVAGDNTIFITPRSTRNTAALLRELRKKIMGGGVSGQ